jgi:hypothetical protein
MPCFAVKVLGDFGQVPVIGFSVKIIAKIVLDSLTFCGRMSKR